MRSGEIQRPDGIVAAFIVALVLHIVLVVLLVMGVRWQTPVKPASVNVMQATVVQDDAARKQVDQLKRESEKLQALEAEKTRQALEALQAMQKEREQQKQLESARLKALEQKALEMKQQAAEKKRMEDKRLAEQKQLAAEQRKKEALQRRQQVESGLQEQLAAEEKERSQAKAAALAASQRGEIARFEDIIRQKVTRSWSRPAGAREGLECVVLVRVVPGGAVLSTQVVRSSGDIIFDRSAENAINKASPLPVPDDKSMFEHFREFEFKFRPEG